ncbi:MAG: HD domain-containing protein [Bdellovibrionales bacterium]|jgi:HD superfamily phosphohydrolase|nr:HD domain-containing protein [Bdellovibrionales bacterium]
MEIKDPIHGAIDLSEAEEAVLDTREFQRLRQIKQLGFAEYSFPGASHTRFLHSVGVMHLAGLAFDSIFRSFKFSNEAARQRLRRAVRLGALLHDIGHGPLSHTTEEVMPKVSELDIKAYAARERGYAIDPNRKATHEDYSIKMVTDSELSKCIAKASKEMTGLHIACLIDRGLKAPDDFFFDQGLDFRPILSQVVSSEMDVDRMDYLERDAYFCGTNYGRVELEWLIGNLTYHESRGKVHLALNRRALYTFDDFLISRHHMYLMVYFHHKSIIFEEMLQRYLHSKDCTYFLPANLDEYLRCSDFSLYEHLATQKNEWAKRIADRRPYRMLTEIHATEKTARPKKICDALQAEGIATIHSGSATRLSKYHATQDQEAFPIFVVDQYDLREKPVPIEKVTRVFQKYEETRMIERIYVAPEMLNRAKKLVLDRKL